MPKTVSEKEEKIVSISELLAKLNLAELSVVLVFITNVIKK